MYLTNKRVMFHSIFNEKSIIFGKDTKVIIPLDRIKTIEKQYNAKIFDNSINFVTVEGVEFFFTSYVYRDQCFEMLTALLE